MTGSGQGKVLGLRDLSGGTAEEQLSVTVMKVLKDVVAMRDEEDIKQSLVGKNIFCKKLDVSSMCCSEKV